VVAGERRRDRLDVPVGTRRVLSAPHYDPEAFGRFSEAVARFFGTAKFLILQSIIVMFWIGYNGWTSYFFYVRHEGVAPFDRYPFILLNLAFSTQAAYAAPLILLAQNRQADRDRVSLEEDRAQFRRQQADMEFLTREVASMRYSLGEMVTRDYLRSELRDLLETVVAAVRAAEPETGDEPDRDELVEAAPAAQAARAEPMAETR
jgi:uncharacterized membrane protein